MTHLSEDASPLKVNFVDARIRSYAVEQFVGFDDVCLIVLPSCITEQNNGLLNLDELVQDVENALGQNATLVILGEPIDLVHAHAATTSTNFQLWISIKRRTPKTDLPTRLPQHHFGALVHTKHDGTLQHTTTRLPYTYCPACNKTTKDYGGKKHTYNSYGTLMSDIWRDVECDLEGDLTPVIERFADLFGLPNYQELRVLDCRTLRDEAERGTKEAATVAYSVQQSLISTSRAPSDEESKLLHGDCLEELRRLPDNSVDFAFIDPPYNLGKNYNNYADDLSIQRYFAWCDEWIAEAARTLRPGRTLALLNIPLWSVRHFLFMETILEFQNWIAWDALSFPVRKIMPAHYAILCFTKGEPRALPGLLDEPEKFSVPGAPSNFLPLAPMDEWYCVRASCIRQRNALSMTDRGDLTDLWWDVHRLKHNSRRVDHPCQLPPQLLYRLISIFTEPNETVLDCFNGAGTTSLTAHQMGRRYIGIEASEKYYNIAQSRHAEIRQGLDPFRKAERKLTEKNSRVARMPKVTYAVPKKTLQLEVRRVANLLDALPTRDDMIAHGKYPIRYYDEYFSSWGEVCAAARHDGMSETRSQSNGDGTNGTNGSSEMQLGLFNSSFIDVR